MNPVQDYNVFGEPLSDGKKFIPKNKEYVDENGIIKWDEYVIDNTDSGFNTSLTCFDGNYKKSIILKPGTKIARYGENNGRYSTDVGTGYDLLAMPYEIKSVPYHEYIVIKPLKAAFCVVEKGFVSAGFDSPGNGIQYKHEKRINVLIKEKVLEEDMSWLQKMKL